MRILAETLFQKSGQEPPEWAARPQSITTHDYGELCVGRQGTEWVRSVAAKTCQDPEQHN